MKIINCSKTLLILVVSNGLYSCAKTAVNISKNELHTDFL